MVVKTHSANGAIEPQTSDSDPSGVPGGQHRARALVDALARSFADQVSAALSVQLDGSTTSLAFVDHYLSLARDEEREPIVSLLAAGAGAYFGELIRRHMGGTWVGDGEQPRRLRLLLEPQFIHLSPVDQAYEAIAGTVKFDLSQVGVHEHTLMVEGREDEMRLVVVDGSTDSGSLDLQPGRYILYCDIAGHRSSGMEARLTVN